MGETTSREQEERPEPTTTTDIKIVVESGMYAGFPRTWRGTVVATIFVRPDTTVAAFLSTINALPLKRASLPVTLESIHMGNFRPTRADLDRTVREMGLVPGTLQIHDGRSD